MTFVQDLEISWHPPPRYLGYGRTQTWIKDSRRRKGGGGCYNIVKKGRELETHIRRAARTDLMAIRAYFGDQWPVFSSFSKPMLCHGSSLLWLRRFTEIVGAGVCSKTEKTRYRCPSLLQHMLSSKESKRKEKKKKKSTCCSASY